MATLQTPLPSVPNFRDVAGVVNQGPGPIRLRTRRLYRAAKPDDASPADGRRLRGEFGVKSIIDLRTQTEHIENARKRDKRIRASAAMPQTEAQASEPLRIPGIAYHDINFNGKAYSDSLLKKLTWPQYLKLVGLMVGGRRVQGIRVLGENVMRPRGLVGLAIDSIDACTKEVKQVFDVLANEHSYPVMIHCTQGKDRTGLTVMLALLVCGVGLEAIQRDYMLSDSELEPERAGRVKEVESIGLTEEFARCDAKLVSAVHAHVVERYGSVGEYLSKACGVTADVQDRVRGILLEQ